MSFMPLELFDNLEYEKYESPQGWVDAGRNSGVRACVWMRSCCLSVMVVLLAASDGEGSAVPA